MKVLFIGDLYGAAGLEKLSSHISFLKKEYKPNIIIINGENAADGHGITIDIYKKIMDLNINLITMGNHLYGKNDVVELLEKVNSNIIRPLNYYNNPGRGYKIINYNGISLLVINVCGRVFMDPNLENGFLLCEKLLDTLEYDYAIIDIHAEAATEKMAFAHFLDRKNLAIVGTHTHVQTNDPQILPKGCLYLTDVGMTGPRNGVAGLKKEIAINKFIAGHYGQKMIVASGEAMINAALFDFEEKRITLINI